MASERKPRQSEPFSEFDDLPQSQLDKLAEQVLLGSITLWPHSISQAAERLVLADFFLQSHRWIFEAMLDLYANQVPVSEVALVGALRDSQKLMQIGGVTYLAELLDHAGTSELGYLIDRIKSKSRLRRIEAAVQLAHSKIQDGEDGSAIIAETQQALIEIDEGAGAEAQSVFDVLDEYCRELEKGITPGIDTGLSDLDWQLGGLQPENQILIVARPSMGKTALAQTLALNIARAGVTVGFFSLEMSTKELAARFISMRSNISTQQLRKPDRLTRDDWAALQDVKHGLYDMPLHIDCASGLNTAALRARAQKMAKRHGLGLLLIDYIGLLRLSDKAESRNHEVGQISRDLKELAKELKIPVVVMCQLSRQPERRQDHRPQLADLRDSGELEQNADVVIGIHREAYYQETPENRNKAELLILKHRNGPTGMVDVCFLKEYTRFENLEA